MLRECFGAPWTWKMKGNDRFYGFTEFRGIPAERGRDRHGPQNQVTAGEAGFARMAISKFENIRARPRAARARAFAVS